MDDTGYPSCCTVNIPASPAYPQEYVGYPSCCTDLNPPAPPAWNILDTRPAVPSCAPTYPPGIYWIPVLLY